MVFQHFEPKSSKNLRFFNGFGVGEASLGRPGPASLARPAWLGHSRPGFVVRVSKRAQEAIQRGLGLPRWPM